MGSISNLDIIIVPAEGLVGLEPGEEALLGKGKDHDREERAGNEIDSIVVLKIQSRPPKPHYVAVENGLGAREKVAEEEGVHGGMSRMERGHGTKRHRGALEAARVEINAKQLVNPCESSRRTSHAVVSWRQSVEILVPCAAIRFGLKSFWK